ncbi:MAG: hypothetical protein Q3999_04830 [Buchananella hordeovulneris]|nr:hypothetical protein [Buchananella hordeovulneris]
MTHSDTARITLKQHLLGATILATQLALALVTLYFLRSNAVEISLAAASISFALPLTYTISVFRNGPFHAFFPAWATNGHLVFVLVPYLAWPYGPPNSIWLWLILAATLVLQLLEHAASRRKQQATSPKHAQGTSLSNGL